MTTSNTVDLAALAADFAAERARVGRRIIVCAGTGCVANGALKLHEALATHIDLAGLRVGLELQRHGEAAPDVWLSRSGCQGFCQMGPLVTLQPDGIMYCKVTSADVPELLRVTLIEGGVVERLLARDPATGRVCRGPAEIPFYTRQQRMVLAGCGEYVPEDLREYAANGGYTAARRAWIEMTPADVCKEVSLSGLRGRGGGGFPTGRKWELTRIETATPKYVVCNGDEGDPGAFMDRSLMEGNPHQVIEGMLIAARAVGADRGYVYVRSEYPLAVKRMRKAIEQAQSAGLLGANIFGTGRAMEIEVMEGAGAFVCGEETALLASIEGRRGMPMSKPPFPAQCGLNGKPTVINNVETLATVPLILRHGVAEFRRVGTANSPGTKTFALTGHVVNTGLIEVPFGASLREVVFNIGGGVIDDSGQPIGEMFKAVQIGGPSGGCLTPEMLDQPLDFDSLREAGAMVGSGGLVVMNQRTCMVEVARFFMRFTQNESCGKCVLCREGTKQMLALLDDLVEGRGTLDTLDLLGRLARTVQKGSLCGLGKTAPNPVLSTLRHFSAEVEAHAVQKRCPAGRCRALLKLEINPELCRGCTLCIRKCPVGAISGEKKQPHIIDQNICTKCGACAAACKFNAITGV